MNGVISPPSEEALHAIAGRYSRRQPARLLRTLFGIVIASVALVPLTRVAIGQDGIVYRSIRAEGHLRWDERKLPRKVVRSSHWGWEVRTGHFVVFSTLGPSQASWTAEQLETAWDDAGRLADRWTACHRQAGFGLGAVGVIITDRGAHPVPGPVGPPAVLKEDATILVDLSRGEADLERRRGDLRREAVAAFLAVAQQDRALPAWVQSGLADYVAQEKRSGEVPHALARPAATRPPAVRVSPGQVAAPAEDRNNAAWWVRYLLEGRDAAHAPAFFDALASAAPGDSLEQLLARVSANGDPDRWLADPKAGQPIVRALPESMDLGRTHREMVFLLKLARRFPAAPAPTIAPRVVVQGVDRTRDFTSPQPSPQPLDLADLHRRLTDPRQPRWATLDWEGNLLSSDERARLEDVLGSAWRRYRVTVRDGRNVLQADLPEGDVLEAWMEENLSDPGRPLAYLKLQSYEPPRQKPAAPAVKVTEPLRDARRPGQGVPGVF